MDNAAHRDIIDQVRAMGCELAMVVLDGYAGHGGPVRAEQAAWEHLIEMSIESFLDKACMLIASRMLVCDPSELVSDDGWETARLANNSDARLVVFRGSDWPELMTRAAYALECAKSTDAGGYVVEDANGGITLHI